MLWGRGGSLELKVTGFEVWGWGCFGVEAVSIWDLGTGGRVYKVDA